MSTHTPPIVDCDRHHPTFPVSDVMEAAAFYTSKLGFSLGFTWGQPPELVGLNLGKVSIHLGKGKPNPAGHQVYFVVSDADELYDFQKSQGVEIINEPEDRPWGLRDFRVRDQDGNVLAFGHYIPMSGEPLPIERVGVPVRLEKRLAALLVDLAAFKKMSVDSCLEEMLLHSFEVLDGDLGVASPHNKGTHRYIKELKKKHGIDYECHDSYRFVESGERRVESGGFGA